MSWLGEGLRLWRKWREGGKRRASSKPTLADSVRSALPPTEELSVYPGDIQLEAALESDVGCEREVNEDSGQVVRPDAPELWSQKGLLVIVADGVGGAAAGEVASRIATEQIARVYYESAQPPLQALKEAIHTANRKIYEAARRNRALEGMGTTCVVLAIKGSQAYAAYVGDSRLYLVREGQIYLLTEDHSFVNEMVRRGLLTREQARQHEDRNLILRALGLQRELELTAWERPLGVRVGDRYVLCSDGLYDLVEDELIKEAVLAWPPKEACRQLVARARERGGYDNITVAIVEVRSNQEAGRAATGGTSQGEAAP